MVRDAVDSLIQKSLVSEEYRTDLEQAVDIELRRQARLYGTAFGRIAATNALALQMFEELSA
jgi:hypothetical protein